MTYWEMAQKQSLPYEQKLILAERRAWEFHDKLSEECHK